MTEIIWKDVVGYEGIYEVSNTGLVRTHADKVTYTKRHGVRRWKQRVLKDKTPKGRGCGVALWKDGKHKEYSVHYLVAEAFMPKVEGKTDVKHIDGNLKNNHISNLEWCNHTHDDNQTSNNSLVKTRVMDKATKRRAIFELERMIQAGASEQDLHRHRVELGLVTSDVEETPKLTDAQKEWPHDAETYCRLKALGLTDENLLFAFNLHPQTLNRMRAKYKITKSYINGRIAFYDQQQCSSKASSQ